MVWLEVDVEIEVMVVFAFVVVVEVVVIAVVETDVETVVWFDVVFEVGVNKNNYAVDTKSII